MSFIPRFVKGPFLHRVELSSLFVGCAMALACNPSLREKSTEATATASTAGEAKLGPVGTIRGTVRVKGDAPPIVESIAPKIPVGKCFAAHETYSKLFREGPGRTLADVLVAATEYAGAVPAATSRVTVTANDCAFDRRTVALQKGQTLSVQNVGKEAYTPQLVGLPTQALLMAIPGGEPIEMTPFALGQYQLVDRSHPFIFTDVFVLNYPTTDVTGLDGKFEITGVPAGKVKLSALLPITGQSSTREVEVPAGGEVIADFEIEFDDAIHGDKARAQPGSGK